MYHNADNFYRAAEFIILPTFRNFTILATPERVRKRPSLVQATNLMVITLWFHMMV